MSNLLDKASILLSPTAYNNGSMLSVKPTDGDGDFTFVRGSAATRVNAQGLVENVQIISSELVTNGDFSNGSTGWTVINGNITDKYNASMTAYQSGIRVTPFNKTGKFKVLFDLVITSGNMKFDAGGVNNQTYTTSGTKEIIIINPTKFEFNAFNLGWVGTLDNVSVKEITDDTNLPRINYEGFSYDGNGDIIPNSGCGSWLLEPQSTNYGLNSEQPSTWHSSGGMDVTANATTSPEGNQNASLAVVNANSGNIFTRNLFSFPSGSGTQTVTVSYFVKYYNNQWVRLKSIFFNGSPANNKNTFFDIQNGLVGTSDSSHTAEIKNFGNGWFRCSITFDIDKDVDTNGYVHIEPMTDDNSNTFASIGQGYSAFGSQGEEQTHSTSYIPTSGATNTRNKDIATNSGNATLINSTEGVLYAEVSALANENLQRILSISDGTNNNAVQLGFLNSATDYRFFANIRLGGVNQAFLTFNLGAVAPTFKKCAIKYKENDFALWIDGVEVATDTSGSTFTTNTLNVLKFTRGDVAQNFFGKNKALAVYKEALTDAELQSLTTI